MLAHLSLDIQITNPGLWISMSFRSKFTKKQTTVCLSSRPLYVENSSLKWSQSCVLMPYYYHGFAFLFQYVSNHLGLYMAFFHVFSIRIFKHYSENALFECPSNRLRTSLEEVHPRSLGVHLLDVVLLAGTSRDTDGSLAMP